MSNLIDTITVSTTVNTVTPDETYIRYIGFSSAAPNSRLYDIDLIKQDIRNYFNIRKGSKLMNPTFGTRIWDLLYEPFTNAVQQEIIDDIKAGIRADPRIKSSDLKIYPNKDESSITVSMSITVLPSNATTSMTLGFNPTTNTVI